MKQLYMLCVLLLALHTGAQVGVNTTTPQAMLDVPASNAATPANTDGILIPRISAFPVVNPTAAQHGMMVFLTAISAGNDPGFYYWDNTTATWRGIVGSVSGGWSMFGNPVTNPITNFLGTTDNIGFSIRTFNKQRFLISAAGYGRFGMNGFSDSLSDKARFEIGSEGIEENDLTLRYAGDDDLVFNFIRTKGSKFVAPSRQMTGNEIASIRFWTYGTGGLISSSSNHAFVAGIKAIVENASGNVLAGLKLHNQSDDGIYINSSGNVGIGIDTPMSKLHVSGKIRMVDGTQFQGYVLSSDNTGLATWVNPGSVFGNNLNSSYDYPTPGAGRTITADAGAVTIAGTDGLVSTGTYNSGASAPNGSGVRMVWNPRKAAFRAGSADFDYWDAAQIGDYSAAFGQETRAQGIYSFAGGYNNRADGEASTSFGYSNISGYGAFSVGHFNEATGDSSIGIGTENIATSLGGIAIGGANMVSGTAGIAFGNSNTASGSYSSAFGFVNSVSGQRAMVFGAHNTAPSFGETVFGIGTTTYTTTTNGATQFRTANGTDRLFTVANAIDANNNSVIDATERSNALVILKNGNTGIGSSTPLDKLHVVGNIRMVDGNQATGRVLTSNANGTATWQTPINTGGTLDNAYDFGGAGSGRTITADAGAVTIAGTDGFVSTGTLNSGAVIIAGAGTRMIWNPRKAAFRAGRVANTQWNDVNVGEFSSAFGLNNTALGYASAAFGIGNLASGVGSISLGENGIASGGNSATFGFSSDATGAESVAMGQNTTTVGVASLSLGNGTVASSFAEVALGQFNTDVNATATGWNSDDRVLVIGNGTNGTTRSNALVFTKSGRLGLGNITPTNQLQLSLNQAAKPGTGTWTITSDERLKTIHGAYSKGLSEITRLNPITYNYKNTASKSFEPEVLKTEFSGFSAQQVQQVFPEAVGIDDDGYLNLNIHPILIASVNAFKELKSENEILKAKVEQQQGQLDDLSRRFAALEAKLNP